jgi:hypothetical protein
MAPMILDLQKVSDQIHHEDASTQCDGGLRPSLQVH